ATEFERVLDNIKKLTRQGTEISYKFLLHPDNYGETYEAARIAKERGCDLIHIRPGAEPWFSDKGESFAFTPEMVERAKDDVQRA
ncbi:MAG: hypothetical protein GWN86_30545, partial [Desulfobacterales bacterium]|nr:hypothetical protein [Desulfobacterales bacterium]